jgi:hypothetical protein
MKSTPPILFRGGLLCILAPVQSRLATVFTELLQLFLDLVVALLVVGRDIVAGFAFCACPRTELTFSSCHMLFLKINHLRLP